MAKLHDRKQCKELRAQSCGQERAVAWEAVARSSGKELWPVVGCGQEQAVARICRQKQGKDHDDELGADSASPWFRVYYLMILGFRV